MESKKLMVDETGLDKTKVDETPLDKIAVDKLSDANNALT